MAFYDGGLARPEGPRNVSSFSQALVSGLDEGYRVEIDIEIFGRVFRCIIESGLLSRGMRHGDQANHIL